MDAQLSRGAAELLRRLTFLSQQRGYAFPSQEYLAGKMGCTVRTIKRHVRELREAGMLTTAKRQHFSQKYEIQKGQNVPSGVPFDVPSAAFASSISEQVRTNPREQHHRDDVALTYESIRKAAGFERLSDGDRRFIAAQLRAGIPERQMLAGIVLGLTRKMTSGVSEPIRSLRYFAATIQEAEHVSPAYIQHCKNWIERHEACGVYGRKPQQVEMGNGAEARRNR